MITASQTVVHSHNPDGTITLDETARHRRRIKLVSDQGVEFILDLPAAKLLRHGEGLVLSDGRVIEVLAQPEAVYRVSGRDPQHLLALAWQVGNRHLAAQIHSDHFLIRKDEVIANMLKGLGAKIEDIFAPFSPESGAYGDAHSHESASGDA